MSWIAATRRMLPLRQIQRQIGTREHLILGTLHLPAAAIHVTRSRQYAIMLQFRTVWKNVPLHRTKSRVRGGARTKALNLRHRCLTAVGIHDMLVCTLVHNLLVVCRPYTGH